MLMASYGMRLGLNGALSKSQGSSPVTSATRTVTGIGTFLFDTVVTADGTPQYSKNGGGLTNITNGLTLAVARGDTLSVQVVMGSAGSATFNLKNNATSVLLEAVTLTRV